MKIHRTAYPLVFSVYLPLFAVYLLLYLFENQQLLGFRLVHWVFLVLALGLLISPQRNSRFGATEPRLAWPLWFLGVVGWVSLLTAYYYFSQRFLGEVLSIGKASALPNPPAFTELLVGGGLFPWALVALFAITLQRTYYQEKTTGLFSDCLQPVFNTTEHNNLGRYCNSYLRYTLAFNLSLPVFFIGIAALYLFSQFSGIPLASGLRLETLFATTVLFYLLSVSRWPLIFNQLLHYRCPAFLAVLILLGSALMVLGVILYAAQIVEVGSEVYAPPFNPLAWPVCWELLTTFIVLGSVPAASTVIAKLSRGYRVDQIIAATLLMPTLVGLLHKTKFSLGATLSLENPIHLAVGLLCCALLLLGFFLKPAVANALWRGTFPRSIANEQRQLQLYKRSATVTGITLIAIFWVSGVYVMALFVTAFTLSSALLIMMTTLVDQRSINKATRTMSTKATVSDPTG